VVLSFTSLRLPDGSRMIVWLYDANVMYLDPRHAVLVLVALVFLLGLMIACNIEYNIYVTVPCRNQILYSFPIFTCFSM